MNVLRQCQVFSTYSAITGAVGTIFLHCFTGFCYLPPFQPLFRPSPLQPLTVGRRGRRRGEQGIDLFGLLPADWGDWVPWIKFSLHLQDISNQQFSKTAIPQQQQGEQQPPWAPWDSRISTISGVLRIPNINYLQLAEVTPFLEHEPKHSGCGQSEAALYPTPRIKTKHIHIT